MRFLLVAPGATWATYDVYTGLLAGVRAAGHDVVEYALAGRLADADRWFRLQRRLHKRLGGPLADVQPSVADVQYHASKDVLERALRFEVDWVLVICAAYFHPDVAILARRAGLQLAVVFTESPYNDAEQAKVAPIYNVCFTNERASVARLRNANPQTHYLPLGYDPSQHGPQLNGEAPRHDVVFVGTGEPTEGFEERLPLLSAIDWTGIDLGLYGAWPDLPASHPLHRFLHHGLVDNARTGALYRAAKVGLNLYRGTGGVPAESCNPRAYELAADGVFTIAQPRLEQREHFGEAVRTFTTPDQLEDQIRTALYSPRGRRETAALLPALVAEDTYAHRAAALVAHLPT